MQWVQQRIAHQIFEESIFDHAKTAVFKLTRGPKGTKTTKPRMQAFMAGIPVDKDVKVIDAMCILRAYNQTPVLKVQMLAPSATLGLKKVSSIDELKEILVSDREWESDL